MGLKSLRFIGLLLGDQSSFLRCAKTVPELSTTSVLHLNPRWRCRIACQHGLLEIDKLEVLGDQILALRFETVSAAAIEPHDRIHALISLEVGKMHSWAK